MENLKVSDIVGQQEKIYTVRATDTVKHMLEVLYNFNIHSAPVMDVEQGCLGLVDVLDLLDFLVHVATKPVESRVTPSSQNLKDDDMDMLLERAQEWNATTVSEAFGGASLVTKIKTRTPFLPCTYGAPLSAVFQNFAKGIGRIPVVHKEQPHVITNILTQSAVNTYLSEHPNLLGDERKKSVKELGFIQGADKVVSVPETTITIDAFAIMKSKGLAGLGILNERGALVGCLSATDVKMVTQFKFKLLLLPVLEFVKSVRTGQSKPKSYLVYVKEDATLEDVVMKLATERVHRLFVVGDHMHPVGVISLTDLSNYFAQKYKF